MKSERDGKPAQFLLHICWCLFHTFQAHSSLNLVQNTKNARERTLHMRDGIQQPKRNEIKFSLFICFELKFVQNGLCVCRFFFFIQATRNHVQKRQNKSTNAWQCLRNWLTHSVQATGMAVVVACVIVNIHSHQHLNRWDNNFVINLFEIYFLELKSFYVYIYRWRWYHADIRACL